MRRFTEPTEPTGPLEPLLAVDELVVTFEARRRLRDVVAREHRRLVAVDGVSLELRRRETLGLVGESGSGKSTLARALVRATPAASGAVRFRGRDVFAMGPAELRDTRREIQLIYQDPYSSLNPRMPIGKAIAEPIRVHRRASADTADAHATELLRRVGLPESRALRRPRALSGGERQRVAIARALATDPKILIADEAVSALDVSIQAQILNLFSTLQEQLGLAMIFISHQLSVVAYIADRVAVMYLGRIVEQGTTNEIFNRPSHPYTIALLAAEPKLSPTEHRTRTPAIHGEAPSPFDIPTGCRFRTRCPLAQDVCRDFAPPPVRVSPTHTSWCHMVSSAQSMKEQSAAMNGRAPAHRTNAFASREGTG